MANLSLGDFGWGASLPLRQARRKAAGMGFLADFVMIPGGTPVQAVGPQVLPSGSGQPMPPNMAASLASSATPGVYMGPPPWGFLPDGTRCTPQVDGAMPGCCPSVESLVAQTAANNPSVAGNAITTVNLLADTLTPFVPQTQPSAAVLPAIVGQEIAKSQFAQTPLSPAVVSPQSDSSSWLTPQPRKAFKIPANLNSVFSLIPSGVIKDEIEFMAQDTAAFKEVSFQPGSGQGANSVAQGTAAAKIASAGAVLAGIGDDDAGPDQGASSLPGLGLVAALVGIAWVAGAFGGSGE
ncbi:MAG: hypothetical protein IT371_30570 [Deltaproteobacteria bacterium]|nr:hypothetical protein [Deltaproteobacteria bacterium]